VQVRVDVGLSDGTSTEVSGELREGEMVITSDGSAAAPAASSIAPRGQPRPPRIL
jgi:hypothetical protein